MSEELGRLIKTDQELLDKDTINLKNILETTISLMELAENFQEVEGKERKDYVIHKMKRKLGDLYPSYEHEIDTIIEAVIFITKLGRVIMLNHQNIKKSCGSCFKF